MIKALFYFEKGRGRSYHVIGKAAGKKIVEPIADSETGEVLVEVGTLLTAEIIERLPEAIRQGKVFAETPLGTYQGMTDQVILSKTPGTFKTILVPRGSSKPEWLT